MTSQLLNMLEKLIGFKSITPNGKDALEFIARYLNTLGFQCTIKNFGPQNEVANLYAVKGENAPNICFAGHVDVVPPMNESLWHSDPFKMKVENGLVFGRGVVDMKGAIACALIATEEFLRNSRLKGSISFLLTTDEEGEGVYGIPKMLEYIRDISPKVSFSILGEPTTQTQIGDTVKIGRRGSINFDLKIIGRQGHVAYPLKAVNPMPKLVSVLNKLVNTKFDSGSEFFQATNMEITSIEGHNDVRNIIPESVSAKFNIRFNDCHSKEKLADIIRAVASEYSDNYKLTYSCSSLPFIQPYSNEMKVFTDIVRNICGTLPKIDTNGGTSDARFIHKYAQVVEFGLNCDQAHKINEHSKICDLQTLYNVYYSTLVGFLQPL
jgi:succinyl-diaminopimelate desuccinylase